MLGTVAGSCQAGEEIGDICCESFPAARWQLAFGSKDSLDCEREQVAAPDAGTLAGRGDVIARRAQQAGNGADEPSGPVTGSGQPAGRPGAG
jgi:hypothetical protein